MGAEISPCGKYRYTLTRDINLLCPEKFGVLFVMLNPSKADAENNDPTITRCLGFAKTWDHAALAVGNLYAYRATKPKDLWRASDPIGPQNDLHLEVLLSQYTEAVCAWGADVKPDRVRAFLKIARKVNARLWCLGTTKKGHPRHPLFVRADQKLIPFKGGK